MEEHTVVAVFGLAPTTTEAELTTLFSAPGAVQDVKIFITDPPSGESSGFGLVSYASKVHATDAVRSLDGHELQGKRLKVEMVRMPALSFESLLLTLPKRQSVTVLAH